MTIYDDRRRADERSRAVQRALYTQELAAIGERRAKALAEAAAELDQVREKVGVYVDAGLSVAEIARLANVSRPTLHAMLSGST